MKNKREGTEKRVAKSREKSPPPRLKPVGVALQIARKIIADGQLLQLDDVKAIATEVRSTIKTVRGWLVREQLYTYEPGSKRTKAF